MLWFFVALQTMAPFVHAHAGAVQLTHPGFLHVHQGVQTDAAWHVTAADAHGAQTEVAQGMPLRDDTLGTMADVPDLVAGRVLPQAMPQSCPGA
jgi:hypothetical protein